MSWKPHSMSVIAMIGTRLLKTESDKESTERGLNVI